MATSGDTDLRRRILDTTRQLLVEQGYAGLSMRKIGRAVGFSATSLYLYFDNKDALFHALIDEGMAQFNARLQEASERHAGDPAGRLRALCRTYIEFGLEQGDYYEIMFVLHPERAAGYPADRYRKARRSLELIERVLAEGKARGAFVVEQPRVAACTIWAVLHGAVSLLLARRLDAAVDPEAFVETTLQQTLRSLTCAEAGSAALAARAARPASGSAFTSRARTRDT